MFCSAAKREAEGLVARGFNVHAYHNDGGEVESRNINEEGEIILLDIIAD